MPHPPASQTRSLIHSPPEGGVRPYSLEGKKWKSNINFEIEIVDFRGSCLLTLRFLCLGSSLCLP